MEIVPLTILSIGVTIYEHFSNNNIVLEYDCYATFTWHNLIK